MNNLRLTFLCIALLLAAVVAKAQVTLGFEGESAASVGIIIKDLKSGTIVAQNDAERALLPASIMKSVTCATALTALGEEFRFSTPVVLYGTQDGSTWNGNLIIESVGDPTIDSELFKDDVAPLHRSIIQGLKDLGITKITGRVIISQPMSDQGCNPHWEIEDTPYAYGAGLYGFNFQDNYYKLWPATGKTAPYVPDLHLSVIQQKSGTDMAQGINSNNLTIFTAEPANPKLMVKVSMDDPALVYESYLKARLKDAGITLEGNDVSDESQRALVCDYKSPVITDILTEMMHESHNLYAEGMLRAIAPNDTREEALKAEARTLKGIGAPTTHNRISDGSGLARANRIQPQFVSSVLEQMSKTDHASAYAATFPKVGVDGTVKNLLAKTSLKGKLALKSGSMGGVQCYAGYKFDDNGRPTHTVVIMVNSFFCPRGELRGRIEKFLLDTFK